MAGYSSLGPLEPLVLSPDKSLLVLSIFFTKVGLHGQRSDSYFVSLHLYGIAQRQLDTRGRTQTTYWLKTCSFINLYWHVQEGKPAKIDF